MRWGYISCSVFILLIAAYLDNIRGPLLPVLTHRLNIAYRQTSWFLVLGSFVGIFCNLALMPLIRRFGERKVILLSCAVAFLASIGGFLVTDFNSLMGLAFLLGVTVASTGALCNILMIQGTDPKSRAKLMCGLHMMYGLGSLLGPMAAQFLLKSGYPWTFILAVAAPFIALTFVVVFWHLPEGQFPPPPPHSVRQLTGLQKMVMITFSVYVSAECLTAMWLTTYLVEWGKLTVAEAAPYATGFFLVLGLSRGVCFLSLRPRYERWAIWLSLTFCAVFFAIGMSGWKLGFAMAGILGPYFPLLLTRVSRSFPEQSRSMTVWILVAVQFSLAVGNLVMGRLTDLWGIQNTYWIPFGLMISALGCLYFYFSLEKEIVEPPLVAVV